MDICTDFTFNLQGWAHSPNLRRFSLIYRYGKTNRTKQLVLAYKSSILPLSHFKKKGEKEILSVSILCFCKKKEKKESFVFASRRPIFLHFVVSHLLHGTPFRLKYCSVVYNVCLIKTYVHLPPTTTSVSGEPRRSSRRETLPLR